MKSVRVILFGCVLALVASGLLLAAPELVIDNAEFDFGFTPQKSKISHTFWLKAAGDDTLKIIKVKPGCGCTKAPLESKILPAGDSTRLEIIFSTRTYRNKISKKPAIQTNAGPPDKRVSFTAQVVAHPDSTHPIVIEPFRVNFPPTADDKGGIATFEIRNVSAEPLSITLIDQPEGMFEIDLPDRVKGGQTKEASIKLQDSSTGPFQKSITLEVREESATSGTRFTIPIKRVGQPSAATTRASN
jgi:hypothetical protein